MIDIKTLTFLYMLADRERFPRPGIYAICLYIRWSKSTFKRAKARLNDLGIEVNHKQQLNENGEVRHWYECTNFNWIDKNNLVVQFRGKL